MADSAPNSGYQPAGGASYPSYQGGGPIFNPRVPFVQGIEGICPNKMIFISGIPHPNPSRFTVYLQQGSQFEPHNVGTCFDARFNFGKDRNVIVRNHKQGCWGQEERHIPYFPFMPNEPFEMIILVEPHCYKLAVNNQHLLEFNHRVQPLNMIDTIRIDGDVRLTQYSYYQKAGGASFPSYPGGGPIFNPRVPFVQGIEGICPNKMIFISGIPHQNPSRFTVYLQQGSQFEPHNVGTCFDARFNFGKDRNVIVRNHKQGCWGQEERHIPYFPFMPNEPFEMIILVEPHCYKLAVNNQHLLEFNHRVRPLNMIDTIRIDGDVRLTQVRFQ